MLQCIGKRISELRDATAVLAASRRGARVDEQRPVDKRYLSDRELAERYGLNVRTLQNWRTFGKGPKFRKFGRSTKYAVSDIETWLESLPCGGDGVPASAVRSGA